MFSVPAKAERPAVRAHTKIVATVGPACDSADMLQKLVTAGVDVFRLNMSHGTHAEIGERHRIIRELEEESHKPTVSASALEVGDAPDRKTRGGKSRRQTG